MRAETEATRRSAAAAITAPAPAAVPFTAATMGRRHWRIAEDEIAGEVRELEQRPVVAREQRADDGVDVAARAEGVAGASQHDRADARFVVAERG